LDGYIPKTCLQMEAGGREGDGRWVPESCPFVQRVENSAVSSYVLIYRWSVRVPKTELEQPTFMADTIPSGDEKTCAGPFPPVVIVEVALLKVPSSKIVKI
jgi:hypothetical protein